MCPAARARVQPALVWAMPGGTCAPSPRLLSKVPGGRGSETLRVLVGPAGKGLGDPARPRGAGGTSR